MEVKITCVNKFLSNFIIIILKKVSKPKGDIMGKGKDAKKSEKKKPLKTAKEKKLAKRMKKEGLK